jgi:YD repeat-containing protein
MTYTSTNGHDHLLEEIVDQAGHRVMKNQYDDEGRVINQWDALDALTSIEYGSSGTATVTNSLDVQTVDVYNDRGTLVREEKPLGITREVAYDGFFNRSAIQDENGNVTYIQSDANGQPHAIRDALDNRMGFGYDAWNNLTSVTDALTRTTSYAYEAVTRTVNGQVVTLTNLITVTDPLSNETVYTYNADGQVTSVTDARGYTATYGPMGTTHLGSWRRSPTRWAR